MNDYWDYIAHAGKKGMKWGYTDGKKNGNRTATTKVLSGIKDFAYGLTAEGKAAKAKEQAAAEQKARNEAGHAALVADQKAKASKKIQDAYAKRAKNKTLTGNVRTRTHQNGRSVYEREYKQKEIDGTYTTKWEVTDYDNYMQAKMLSYRRKKATSETAEEKKKRMKAAKKRYNKETRKTRAKRAVQKAIQNLARKVGGNVNFGK